MIGAVFMILLLVVILPVGIIMSGAMLAAVLGGLLKREVDTAHVGSELLELSEVNSWVENGSQT